jgi:hypothetical protein
MSFSHRYLKLPRSPRLRTSEWSPTLKKGLGFAATDERPSVHPKDMKA